MKQQRQRNTILAFAILLVAAELLILISGGVQRAHTTESDKGYTFPVKINEIMSANESYPDAQGAVCDWVELYNESNGSIDLSGYKLTDNNRKIRYTFPSGSKIASKGYLVVYCQKNAGAPYADFSIAKTGGESIILMTSRNVAVDHMESVALRSDESYARMYDGSWAVLAYGTPGYDNSESGQEAYLSDRRDLTNTVVINEVLSSNSAYPDAQGAYYDWVELYNAGSEAVSLGGYHLTDRLNSAGYQFPEGTALEAGKYLLVYCDGAGQKAGYAPFAISGRVGEHIMLTDQSGKVIDDAAVPVMEENESYARSADGTFAISGSPTPALENSEAGRSDYLASLNTQIHVSVTEVMAANLTCIRDADGDFSDWIELTNYGAQSADLSGYYLSDRSEDDRRWAIPALHLAPGERVVVFCSGRNRGGGELHTDFSLNGQGETVYLFSPLGTLVSSLAYPAIAEDQSYCADENGGSAFVTGDATPGFPNTDEGYIAYESSLAVPDTLAFSEAMSGNGGVWQQSNDEYYDWIEFVNASDEAVNLADYYVTDDLENPLQCRLPSRNLASGGVFSVLCTGSSSTDGVKTSQIDLSLDARKETLYLVDANGQIVDCMRLSDLTLNGSYGRMAGTGGFFYFEEPTPNEGNRSGYRIVSDLPAASLAGGIFDQTSVEVSLDGANTIYYTLDGSTPTAKSAVYTKPLTLTQTTVVRAVSIRPNSLPSRVLTNTYFLDAEHELPIVSLTVDPAEMFGSNGITSSRNRYNLTFEKLAHVEYYFEGGGFSTDCGIRLHGDMSRVKSGRNKRSYKLLFRERYGESPLIYPIFQNSKETVLYSIVLRNGSDALQSVIKDELVTNIAARTSPQLCVMDSRYCALYINGAYEGLYPIREGLSPGYYAARYGVSKDSVVMHRPDNNENKDFEALLSYAANHDLTIDEYYRYLESRIDFDSVIDWLIYEAYAANSDVEGNVRYYRSTEGDGKWRYALFDLDYGMKSAAGFQYLLNGYWDVIPRKLLQNEEFLDRFLTRFAYLMEHDLSQESVLAEFDYLTNLIRPELARDRLRWNRTEDLSYEFYFDRLKNIILMDRAQQMKVSLCEELRIPMSQIESYFGKKQ